MAQFIVELSLAEEKALAVVALSPQEWINNVVKQRCRISIDEIVQAEVRRLLDAGLPIPATRDEIVLNAPVKTLAEVETERLAPGQVSDPVAV